MTGEFIRFCQSLSQPLLQDGQPQPIVSSRFRVLAMDSVLTPQSSFGKRISHYSLSRCCHSHHMYVLTLGSHSVSRLDHSHLPTPRCSTKSSVGHVGRGKLTDGYIDDWALGDDSLGLGATCQCCRSGAPSDYFHTYACTRTPLTEMTERIPAFPTYPSA